jgi:SAM-dependent methyltransferase
VPAKKRKKAFSEDYHDYVFRQGRLLGDFDNMYRHAKGVPWDQDTRCDHWYTEVGAVMLRAQAPYSAILEIGCGLGFFAAKLKQLPAQGRARANILIDAFDVSPEGISKAKRLHQGIGFYVDDITKSTFCPKRQYDLVVLKEIFWYVFGHMKTVVRNVSACVKPSGFLYIGQSFPAPDRPFVGKRVIPDPESLLRCFAGYERVYTALLRNNRHRQEGWILHCLSQKPTDLRG